MQQGKYEDFNDFFTKAKVPLRYFGNSSDDLAESEKRKTVFVMTYHSDKGLDFPHVFIPGRATGSGRTHNFPEPKTVTFRSVLVQRSKGTA